MKPKCSFAALASVLAAALSLPVAAEDSARPVDAAYEAIKVPLQEKVDEGSLAPEYLDRFLDALDANRESLEATVRASDVDGSKDAELTVRELVSESGLKLTEPATDKLVVAVLAWARVSAETLVAPTPVLTVPEPTNTLAPSLGRLTP